MNNLPLVSVVIPTYNRAHLIERAVQSVLHQTYPHIELIVVDDGSTDDTADVLARLSDPRLHYIRLPHNIGGGGARNVGLQQSHGKYVSFLDSDDEFLPTMLEKLVALLEQVQQIDRHAGVVYCSHYINYSYDHLRQRQILSRTPMNNGNVLAHIWRGWTYPLSTFLLRRELVVAVGGFDERLPRLQDYELWVRLAQVSPFYTISEPLVIKHEFATVQTSRHPTSIERALHVFLERWESMLQRELGAHGTIQLARQFRQNAYLSAALLFTKQGNRRAAIATIITCIRKTGWIPAPRFFWALLPIVVGTQATHWVHHLVAAYKRWWASSVAAAR